MEDINNNYTLHCDMPSDINEHLKTLAFYAKKCQSITEFGMRSVVSTWAFLYGLSVNNKNNKTLISVDLDYSPNIENIKKLAPKVDVNFCFIMGNDVKINIHQTDLLFIDTWHIYSHLQQELKLHASKVNKYIILHDTTIDADLGETIRNGWNAEDQALEFGYPVEGIRRGLWPAVTEFLENNAEWVIKHRYTNNNGLTILSRK